MTDTLAQLVGSGNGISLILSTTLGGGGFAAAVGKILWDIWKAPRKTCALHNELSKNISTMTTDMAVLKNDISWLVSDYKRRNDL